MNVKLMIKKIWGSILSDGIQASARKARGYFVQHRNDDFDMRNGTDTAGIAPLWKFQIPSANASFGAHYVATSEHDLVNALRSFPEPLNMFTFIDIGCGKGKTLLVASQLGFRRVVGVEFAPELAAIARANVSVMKLTNVSVIYGDAADFHFPDEPLIVYLYNPFSANVMQKVITNLGKSKAQPTYVVYKNPTFADAVLDSSTFLTRFGGVLAECRIFKSGDELQHSGSTLMG